MRYTQEVVFEAYVTQCGVCGQRITDDCETSYSSKEGFMNKIKKSGWAQTDRGFFVCPKHAEELKKKAEEQKAKAEEAEKLKNAAEQAAEKQSGEIPIDTAPTE